MPGVTNGDPAFPAALRAAIERRGISLDRLRERLRVMGTPVSTATLSYWQSGRTQPERSVSLAALGNIEHIVGVPPGALATLLDPPKPRGRARTRQTVLGTEFFPDVAPLERLLAGFDLSQDAHLTRLSGHDRIRVDAGRGVDRRISRQVLRAEADDIDRLVVIDQMDLPCSRPRLRAVRNCALGRVEVDLAAGLVAAELLFSRPLARNETILIEHSLEFPSPAPSSHYERRCRTPVREYLVEVRFDPRRLPERVVHYWELDGVEKTKPAPLDEDDTAHAVVLDFGPGRSGLRWSWPDG
ncbi:hypothetical protein GCM10023148_44040 [Actinokineospora soli]